jgi:hypothetical protein
LTPADAGPKAADPGNMCLFPGIHADHRQPDPLSCTPSGPHARQNFVSTLPSLPDPESITDESSAADALSSALVAAATANRTLKVAPETDEEREHGPRHARTAVPPDEWEVWLREFHRLLVKIAVRHPEIVSWSVTVGIDFSLTVNFADRKARAEHNSDLRDPSS